MEAKPKRSYYLPNKLIAAFDKECEKSGYVREKVVAGRIARKFDAERVGHQEEIFVEEGEEPQALKTILGR